MQTYDIIMLIVLGATTFIGFRKGLVWQLASLAAIVVSYLVAVQFRDVLSNHIDAEPPWNTFLAMLILYIGTSFVIWLVFQFVRGFIDRAKLREFDRQLGAIFGLAKGVLLCVIITLFAVTLLGDQQRQQIIDSKSGLYIAQLLDRADAVMPDELHDFLHPYLHRLDGDPSVPSMGQDLDEFRRLEDWLEGGQGLEPWGGRSSSASTNGLNSSPAADGFGGRQSAPAYQAERDVYRRGAAPQ
jgi:membrane protein required for colicin V production